MNSKLSEIVTATIKDLLEKFPNASNSAIARIVYGKNPTWFTNIEHARSRVRYLTGQLGENSRNTDEKYHTGPKPKNPFGKLPKGDVTLTWKPYKLKAKKTLFMSDIHVPYHDEEAVKIALQKGLDEGVDAIVFLGDICDFYNISRWEKLPHLRDFSGEVDACKTFFEIARECFPEAEILFKIGNHELRYEKYLVAKAPELLGLAFTTYAKLLDLDKLNIRVIDQSNFIDLNDLLCMHGHEVKLTSGVHPARILKLRMDCDSLAGHIHRTSSYVTKCGDGRLIRTYTLGCLCELRASYAPVNQWNHGFAIVNTIDGRSVVDNYRIEDGKSIIY